MKASFEAEAMKTEGLTAYGRLCAWTLARAHARSGDAVAIAAYLGSSDKFDRSITDFSERYADQNQKDFDAFVGAVKSGRLEATEGI
jgi:predicted alpha/beta hydrolase